MYIVDIYSYYLLCARSQCVTKYVMNELSVEAYGMVSRDHIRGFILVECVKYHFYIPPIPTTPSQKTVLNLISLMLK